MSVLVQLILAGILMAAVGLVAPALANPVKADPAALQADIESLRDEIAEAQATAARYEGGLVGSLAATRREVLLLSIALLRNRLIALEGDTASEIVVPRIAPDPTKAEAILQDIIATEKELAAAKVDAAATGRGGLVGALAQTTVVTHQVSIAQLKLAYYQAAYGIALPVTAAQPDPLKRSEQSDNPARGPRTIDDAITDLQGTVPESPGGASALPEWADRDRPEIDYNRVAFEISHLLGREIAGWWSIGRETSDLDDSPIVFAQNLSQKSDSPYGDDKELFVRCREDETSLILAVDKYLLSGFDSPGLPVDLRIDDFPAERQTWAVLISNKGVGISGDRAIRFLRRLFHAERLYLRVTESNGAQHDANFKLAGIGEAIAAVSEACGWALQSHTKLDYAGTQRRLKDAGFDPGPIDGRWGPGSRAAMAKFQAANGLEQTGLPDEVSLKTLSFGVASPPKQEDPADVAELPADDASSEDRLTSILSNVERLKNSSKTQPQQPVLAPMHPDMPQTAAVQRQQLNSLLLGQIQRCWRQGSGARQAEDLIVEVTVNLAPDGRVIGAPRVVDTGRVTRDAYFRSAAENAVRAILQCSPFELPVAQYSEWKTMNLTFNPREMFGS